MSKTFTLGEAQTLLPVLEALLKRAQAMAGQAKAIERQMQELNQRIFLSGGMRVDIAVAARRRAEREKAAQESKDAVSEIEEIGARVHELDRGLLDLPCLADGRVVMLCWKMGEPAIAHWHDEDEAVEARRPVDTLFERGSRERLN